MQLQLPSCFFHFFIFYFQLWQFASLFSCKYKHIIIISGGRWQPFVAVFLVFFFFFYFSKHLTSSPASDFKEVIWVTAKEFLSKLTPKKKKTLNNVSCCSGRTSLQFCKQYMRVSDDLYLLHGQIDSIFLIFDFHFLNHTIECYLLLLRVWSRCETSKILMWTKAKSEINAGWKWLFLCWIAFTNKRYNFCHSYFGVCCLTVGKHNKS